MRNIQISLVILGLTLTVVSCKKEDDKEGIRLSGSDYLVFGHFYGECGGEQCIETFKLEHDRLSEDDNDTYPPQSLGFYNGHYNELGATLYNQVKDIVDYFPTALLNETETTIGMPDAGDWGGVYIEYKVNGVHKYWLVDQKTENDPSYLGPFVVKINEKIAIINN